MISIPRVSTRVAGRTAAGLVVTLIVTACGSQIDPATVALANVSADGAGPAQVLPGADPVPGTPATGSDVAGEQVPGTASGPGQAPVVSSAGPGGDNTPVDTPPENAPAGDTKAGSCDGFENQTGITDKTIVIGNAADISGPVPGLFESSQQAVRAYAAYFNSTSDICGRKLEVKTYDSRTDAGADQQAYVDGCENTFAMVGSMSAFDSGGASATQACGVPDLRSAAVTVDRQRCTVCYGAQSVNPPEFQNAVPDYALKFYPDAAQHAALLFINAGAAAENGPVQAANMEKRGMNFDYVQGIDIAEFNYAPYVQQMKDKGIKWVQLLGATASIATRMAQAMQQQGFEPDVFMADPTTYTPDYVESAGEAGEGTTIFINFTPFEEASQSKELQLYLGWLQQVQPGATPSFFGLFSWSAARLFVERATALGGRLSRKTLLSELSKVDDWTANGLHSPQHVGPRRSGDCWRFIKLVDSTWVPTSGTKYHCSGTTISD